MADFSTLNATRFPMPLQATGMTTVGPDRGPSWDERVFGSDSVVISSDGNEVRIDPKYWANTGDSIYVNGRGEARAEALWGLIGYGDNLQRRADVLAILRRAQGQAEGTTAARLAQIVQRLEKR